MWTCGALSGERFTAVSGRKLGFSDTCRMRPRCVCLVKLRLSSHLFNTHSPRHGLPDTCSITLRCVAIFIYNLAYGSVRHSYTTTPSSFPNLSAHFLFSYSVRVPSENVVSLLFNLWDSSNSTLFSVHFRSKGRMPTICEIGPVLRAAALILRTGLDVLLWP